MRGWRQSSGVDIKAELIDKPIKWLTYHELIRHYIDGSLPDNILLSHAMHLLQHKMEEKDI